MTRSGLTIALVELELGFTTLLAPGELIFVLLLQLDVDPLDLLEPVQDTLHLLHLESPVSSRRTRRRRIRRG